MKPNALRCARILAQSERGRQAMRTTLQMLDEGGIYLDRENQNALLTLLTMAYGDDASTACGAIEEILNLTVPMAGTRLLLPSEVPQVGDFSRWSESPHDNWIKIRPGQIFLGVPVATMRVRCGQPQLAFCTYQK